MTDTHTHTHINVSHKPTVLTLWRKCSQNAHTKQRAQEGSDPTRNANNSELKLTLIIFKCNDINCIYLNKGKDKVHPSRDHEGPEGEQRYSSILSLTSALDGVGGQCHAPAVLPPAKTRYPLYRRLDEPQGRSGWVRKISPPQGFDPPNVQPIVSRYTDWAIPAQVFILIREYNLNAINAIPVRVDPVYNDIGLCDTSYITSDIPPCSPQQYNPQLNRHSFKGTQNIPFHDVITEFHRTLNRINSEYSATDLRFWRW
jgi:hypothetical protein